MRFRLFSVKNSDFSDFVDFFLYFLTYFFDDLLNLGLLPFLKPSITHGSPIVVFYLKSGKKIGLPMPSD